MIFESGAIIFAGIAFMATKLETKTFFSIMGRSGWANFVVAAVTFFMHYGTFSGVMSAAVAGLMCEISCIVIRKGWGYRRDGKYYPGIFFVRSAI